MKVIEIGAGASGFQFCLSGAGINVTSVDPLENPSEDVEWRFTEQGFERLNHAFGGRVTFIRDRLENCGLPDRAYDRVFAISVLEHVPESQIGALIREAARVLRPGGCLVATIDLFLDLVPFTNVESNIYGRNVSVRALVEESGLRLVVGERMELYGYDEFVPESVSMRAKMGEFYVKNDTACQAIVLEKASS